MNTAWLKRTGPCIFLWLLRQFKSPKEVSPQNKNITLTLCYNMYNFSTSLSCEKAVFWGTKARRMDLNSDLSTVQQHLHNQTLCYRTWGSTCRFHSWLFFLQLLKPLLQLQVAFGCSFLDPPLLDSLSPAYSGMSCYGFLCNVCCVSKLFRKEKMKRKRYTAHSTLFWLFLWG